MSRSTASLVKLARENPFHFFTLEEVHELMGQLFRPIYVETHDHRLAPDFTRMIARWIIAAEKC